MADPKERAQIELIRSRLGVVDVYPDDWAQEGKTSEYLYRRNRVLVRTEDVERVRVAITTPTTTGDDATAGVRVTDVRVADGEFVSGVTVLDLVGSGDGAVDVPGLLAQLDGALGPGVAHPETVVYGVGYGCPATEPEEVPVDTRHPWPRAATRGLRRKAGRRGRCACCGGKRCCCSASVTGDGAGVRVAIFDTGLSDGAAQSHYWMNGVTGEQDPHQVPIGYGEGHGTFSAGVLRSVAPAASVHVYRALENAGAAFEGDVVRKMADVLGGPGPKPDVILVCFVTAGRNSTGPLTFERLFATTISTMPDVAVVAPAGNDGKAKAMYPGAFGWAVSVGALDTTFQHRAYFSNFGPAVDVYAPGEDLVNAFAQGCYDCHEPDGPRHRHFSGMARWSGTSFSAPMVAGMIAAEVSAGPLSAQQVKDRLVARAQQTSPLLPVLLP